MFSLNSEQRRAVEHQNGPLLVLAGAGAGKTRVVTHRILNLIKNGVTPSSVLAITFTNKAAKEMRSRVEELLSSEKSLNRPVSFNERPFVSTFHSLGVHILRENGGVIGLSRNFSIFDRSDSLSLMREAIKELGFDSKQFEPGRFLHLVSKEKGEGRSIEDMRENEDESRLSRIFISFWEKYEEKLRREKALDFDDLLLKTLILLRKPEIKSYYQGVWHYVHVDEYQDTNRVQYEIVKLLVEKERNVCVVGDIDQSIYSWRGADFKNIMRFEKDFREATTIILEENYRSTKTIIEAANSIISKNTLRKEKGLFTKKGVGEKITVYNASNEADEARFVTETCIELIDKGVPPKDIAVLYRANFQSRILEESFLSYTIPYQVLGTRFFERKEVKDMVSYLRAAMDQDNISDFKRIVNVPPRGIGKVTLLKIIEKKEEALPASTRLKIDSLRTLLKKIKESATSKPLSETLIMIFRESELEFHLREKDSEQERVENIYELITLSTKYDSMLPEKAVESFLADAALSSDQDELKEEKNAVRLMTVHAAKGLEFPYVFITGLEEDLFPHSKPDGKEESLEEKEEERRLFYVALTRAKDKLYLTHAAFRSIFGSPRVNVPSEFLMDLDDSLLEEPFAERGEKIIYLK